MQQAKANKLNVFFSRHNARTYLLVIKKMRKNSTKIKTRKKERKNTIREKNTKKEAHTERKTKKLFVY